MNNLIKYGQCKKLGCAWPLNKDGSCDKCSPKCPFCGKNISSVGVICNCEVFRTDDQIRNDEMYD